MSRSPAPRGVLREASGTSKRQGAEWPRGIAGTKPSPSAPYRSTWTGPRLLGDQHRRALAPKCRAGVLGADSCVGACTALLSRHLLLSPLADTNRRRMLSWSAPDSRSNWRTTTLFSSSVISTAVRMTISPVVRFLISIEYRSVVGSDMPEDSAAGHVLTSFCRCPCS